MHPYSSDHADRRRAFAALAVTAAVLAIGAGAAADRLPLPVPAWLLGPPTLAAWFAGLYLLTDKVLWRTRAAAILGLPATPDIAGTYHGLLIAGAGGTDRRVSMRIEQTWTGMSVRFQALEPATSASWSLSASLTDSGSGRARLIYTYANEVRPGVADADMHDHAGTAQLDFLAGGRVEGRYFNARGRAGTLDLRKAAP